MNYAGVKIPLVLLGGRVRAKSVEVKCDNYSNLLTVEIIYKASWFHSKFFGICPLTSIQRELKKQESKSIMFLGCSWGDADCKTVTALFQIIPECGVKYF